MQFTVRSPRLGQAPVTYAGPLPATRAMLVNRRVEAAGLIFGGLFSAASLILFAMGRERAGYMLGVASALWGATIGAIRVLGSPPGTSEDGPAA